MIYIGTVIVLATIRENQTFLGLAAELEGILSSVGVPWACKALATATHMAFLETIDAPFTPKSGFISPRQRYQRLLFALYGPQGRQGNEGNDLPIFRDRMIAALAKRHAGLQVIDFYGKLDGRVYPMPPPEIEKTKFRVELTTLAKMRGSIVVEARDATEAKMLAEEKAGDVEWKYEGACEGEEGPEAQDVQATS